MRGKPVSEAIPCCGNILKDYFSMEEPGLSDSFCKLIYKLSLETSAY